MCKKCFYQIENSDGTIYFCKKDAIQNSDFCYLHDSSMDIDEKIKLLKADLPDGFSGADFTGAKFEKADFRGEVFIGANFRGAVLKLVNFQGAFLSEANLEKANLTESNLTGAFLKGSNLKKADLTGADLTSSFLLDADLSGANLIETIFIESNLIEVKLNGASLIGANFKETDMTGANLTGAFIEGFKINNTNLINVIWAEKRTNKNEMDFSKIKCTLHELVQIKNYYQEIGNFKLADAFYIEQIERIQRLIPRNERTIIRRIGYRLWRLSSNYGVSIWRWQAWLLSIAAFFGFVYWKFELIKYSNPLLGPVEGYSHFYFSFITITTLGFGDIIAKKGAGEVVVTLEVLLGYMMLGGLMGIFTKKFIRN